MNSFSKIYEKNIWGGSGTGSKYNRDNKALISKINEMIKEYDIKNVYDFGCGDFEIMKHLNFDDINYTGGDVVESVINKNTEIYSNEKIKFIFNDKDITGYDLVIIKDVLQHHTDEDVKQILGPLIEHNKYVFSINGYKFTDNRDIHIRDINNRYRYYPISSDKYPLNTFTHKELFKYHHRIREFILYY